MVVEYGMSDLGPINFGPTMDITEWGKSYYEQNNVSQEMLAKIDQEIRRIITEKYTSAVKIVSEKRDILDKVADALMKTESLDEDEFLRIVGPRPNQDENFATY